MLPIELIRNILEFLPNIDPDIKREYGLIKKIDETRYEPIKRVCRVYSNKASNLITNSIAYIYELPYYELESFLWNVHGCLIINITKRTNSVFGNSSTSYSTVKTICNCNNTNGICKHVL